MVQATNRTVKKKIKTELMKSHLRGGNGRKKGGAGKR